MENLADISDPLFLKLTQKIYIINFPSVYSGLSGQYMNMSHWDQICESCGPNEKQQVQDYWPSRPNWIGECASRPAWKT